MVEALRETEECPAVFRQAREVVSIHLFGLSKAVFLHERGANSRPRNSTVCGAFRLPRCLDGPYTATLSGARRFGDGDLQQDFSDAASAADHRHPRGDADHEIAQLARPQSAPG